MIARWVNGGAPEIDKARLHLLAAVWVGVGMDEVGLDDLCRFATRPLAFIGRYLRRRSVSHAVIMTAVLTAVGCSVTTQYGVKTLVDAL
ncbi:MAG: hypothetical protein WCF49_16330, partial [Xanthobacteraceae bacterium]